MTEHRVKVLIIDENPGFLKEAATELSGHFSVHTSATGENGLKVFAQLRPQVVIVDTGIADIPFSSFLNDLKGLDGAVLRIAVARDYSALEMVVQAIDTAHIHKYFRKPVNYFDLIEIINARTVNYQVGRGFRQGADPSAAYEKLHSIVDKAKEVEKLRQQLDSQMAKIRDVETESFNKVKDALGEVIAFRKKIADKEAVISSLHAKSLELEELKKRDIDRVEQERAALWQELKGVQDGREKLLREKADIELACKVLKNSLNPGEKEDKDSFPTGAEEPEITRAEIIPEKTILVADRIKDLTGQARTVVSQNARLSDEIKHIQSDHEELRQEMEKLRAENGELRVSVPRERKTMIAEMTRERRTLEEGLARKKDEAERIVEVQKERNKAKLQKMQDIFEEEKQRAAREIDRLQAELQENRKARVAEIKQERKRSEAELEDFRRQQAAEKAAMEKSLKEEKQRTGREIRRLKAEFEADREARLAEIETGRKRVEEELARKKDEANRIVEVQKERNKAELQKVQDAFEKEKKHTTREIERFKAAFEADREARLAEIETGRKRVEEELARKKDEANRIVEVQKERNKAELQKMQDAFEKEKKHTAREIERFKAAFEADREAKLAEVEEDRKRVEEELAGTRARMKEEKDELEKSVQEQREKAEADIRRSQESAALEQKKLVEALEAKLAAMKGAAEAEAEELRARATRELDRFRVEAQKKERELGGALVETRRLAAEAEDQVKLAGGRIQTLEAEIEKNQNEKDLVLRDLESVRGDFDVAIQSREALVAEVADLRAMLR